jgi:nucleoside-diphosphate-sugar epimerase
MRITALARVLPATAATQPGVSWKAADLWNPPSLTEALGPGDVVINLAYASDLGEAENIRLLDNLTDACLRRRVSRLVHCSTAVVAGAARVQRVTESTRCEPRTPYERAKWAIEQRVLAARSRGLDVGIVRPTAVVGAGGRNLHKLATSLLRGSPVTNYVRACLFGHRIMHVVSVRTVAAALVHLAQLPAALDGNVYHVSSDDDPGNTFDQVEQVLRWALGQERSRLPAMPLPAAVLSVALGLAGRSDTDPKRRYDSAKLLATNFTPVHSVATAVHEFGRAFLTDEQR